MSGSNSQRSVRLQRELAQHMLIEERVAERMKQLRDEEAFNADQLVQEARLLNLGLRFSRHGEKLTRRGRVYAHHATDDSVVFALKTEQNETFKLSAPREVANLRDLVGKEVTLTGRRLELNAVKGPVIIVARVLLVSN
jgi:hypothetical protein